jgi:DNA-binding transcriptional LysR family regulator
MFIAVVDAGSFTLAAAALGQTKAVVSFNVRNWKMSWG